MCEYSHWYEINAVAIVCAIILSTPYEIISMYVMEMKCEYVITPLPSNKVIYFFLLLLMLLLLLF